MKTDGEHAPESAYVRDNYDALLAKLPNGYTDFRWNDTDISRFHYRQSRRALLRALDRLPTGLGRALEVGGGAGAWTPFFAPRTSHLDFLDISENMLAEAKKALVRFNNIRYLRADFLEWEPEPSAYDMVVSIRNIEYMKDKNAVFARISRALRHGGMLVLSTKSPDFDWKGYFDDKMLHGGQIPVGTLVAMLRENGFEIMRVYPAILGKLIRFAPMRAVWDGLQTLLLHVPQFCIPLFLLKYISESFLVVARRI